mmetsp:Transcript_42931/g.93487  ORF Transcript_42931/g.93487 Transcript_42931/m.93487 type:complete len:290 (+) Transcript_42931:950-1819(+)
MSSSGRSPTPATKICFGFASLGPPFSPPPPLSLLFPLPLPLPRPPPKPPPRKSSSPSPRKSKSKSSPPLPPRPACFPMPPKPPRPGRSSKSSRPPKPPLPPAGPLPRPLPKPPPPPPPEAPVEPPPGRRLPPAAPVSEVRLVLPALPPGRRKSPMSPSSSPIPRLGDFLGTRGDCPKGGLSRPSRWSTDLGSSAGPPDGDVLLCQGAFLFEAPTAVSGAGSSWCKSLASARAWGSKSLLACSVPNSLSPSSPKSSSPLWSQASSLSASSVVWLALPLPSVSGDASGWFE